MTNDVFKPTKINSSNLEEAVFTYDFDESVEMLKIGGMKITFSRGDSYVYYPMSQDLYSTHLRLMLERGVSAGVYFRKNIMNMFQSKKI